jgi:NAD(P)-dependent dehydrogenase (short-subunit alcohol dehydrogenase family)
VAAVEADVRDLPALRNVVDQFGHIDFVCANAGIANGFVSGWELDEAMVRDVIDIDLVGLRKTTTAAVPAMIDTRRGSTIPAGSVAGLVAFPHLTHYSAAKHGVVGLMKPLAIELAPHRIRANSVHPEPSTPGWSRIPPVSGSSWATPRRHASRPPSPCNR